MRSLGRRTATPGQDREPGERRHADAGHLGPGDDRGGAACRRADADRAGPKAVAGRSGATNAAERIAFCSLLESHPCRDEELRLAATCRYSKASSGCDRGDRGCAIVPLEGNHRTPMTVEMTRLKDRGEEGGIAGGRASSGPAFGAPLGFRPSDRSALLVHQLPEHRRED
jgi:hypothetical protein